MAAPRKKPVTIEDVFPENLAPPQFPVVQDHGGEPVEYDDVTALNNVLAELGEGESGGGFINIYREKTLPGGRKGEKEYIGRFDAIEFTNGGLLESIKSQHGAGTYEISVYHSGGNGLATRKKITIAADPVSAAPPVPVTPDLTPIITAINQNADKTLQAILALAQSSAQKTPSRAEMLEEMQIMQRILQPAQPAAPAYNPIEMMKMGMEMAQLGAGGGDGNNAWVSKMIETFGGPMMGMIAQAQATKAAQPAPAAIPRAPAQPALTAPTAAQPQPSEQEQDPVKMYIAAYLNFLVSAAKANAPVDEYADSILVKLSDSEVVELEKFLLPDNWRELAKQYTTAIEQYPVWFTALRDTLLQFIKEDREAPPEENPLTPSAIADIPAAHENANTGFDGGDGGNPGVHS